MRIGLKCFRVTWSEGPLRTPAVSLTSWAEANRVVAAMIAERPARRVVRARSGFSLEWADGMRYVGGFELSRLGAAAGHRLPLSRHVRVQLETVAGRRRPPHMSESQYDAFIEAQEAAAIERARRLLDGYDLGDQDQEDQDEQDTLRLFLERVRP